MNKVIIETKGLYRYFYKDSVEIKVLENINLTIKERDKIAITGKSGSGKSTLLNLIGSLDTPTKGKIFFKGKDITNLTEDDLSIIRNKHIGFVFQFHYLIKELTAFENVILPGLIGKEDLKKIKQRADELFDDLELGDRKTHRPSELSGGEQQRIAIARALVNYPDVLLADEPTGNLDTKSTDKILDLLDKLQKKYNLTLVIVTHNNEIAKRCKRVVKLEDGQIKELY